MECLYDPAFDGARASYVSLDHRENKGTGQVVPGALARREALLGDVGWGQRLAQCGGRTLVRVAGDRVSVFPSWCDRWSCSWCGPYRQRWLVKQVRPLVEQRGMRFFWTFTLSTGAVTARRSEVFLKESWKRFRTYWVREHPLMYSTRGAGFSFFWTYERTQVGQSHLHLLTDRFLEHGEVSGCWSRATAGSYVVYVRRLQEVRESAYLTKYVVKEAQERRETRWNERARAHLYGHSRDLVFDPYRLEGDTGTTMEWVPYKRVYTELVGGQLGVEQGGRLGMTLTLSGREIAAYRSMRTARSTDIPSPVHWLRVTELRAPGKSRSAADA